MRLVAACTIGLLLSSTVSAHAPGRSFLLLRGDHTQAQLRWDVSLADADLALGLDGDGDGTVSAREADLGEAALFAYAQMRLGVWADDRQCALIARRPLQVAEHQDGRHLVLRFALRCPATPHRLRLRSQLLQEQDPAHRSLVRLKWGESTQSGVLSSRHPQRQWALNVATQSSWLDLHLRAIATATLVLLLALSIALLVGRSGWRAAWHWWRR